MAQIFPPWWNKLPIAAAIAGLLVPTLAVAGIWYFFYAMKHSHLGRHEHVGLIHDD